MRGAVALAAAALLLPVPAAGAAAPQYVIRLTPPSQTVVAGRFAWFEARVTSGGQPASRVRVDYQVLDGPNAGPAGSGWTDDNGYVGFGEERDVGVTEHWQVSATESSGAVDRSDTVTATWLPAATITLAPPARPAYAGYPTTLRATVTAPDDYMMPKTVDFAVAGGNAGTHGTVPITLDTPTSGHADFQYTSDELTGDTVTAGVKDWACTVDTSAPVTVRWTTPFAVALTGDQHLRTGQGAWITAAVTNEATGQRYAGGGSVQFSVGGANAGPHQSVPVGADGTATFEYTGTHPGTDTVRTSFVDPTGTDQLGGTTVEWAAPIRVTAAYLTVDPWLHGQVAAFTVDDPAVTADRYRATVDWGDGTAPSAGRVSGPTGGPFTVSGDHEYPRPGSYRLTVTVTDTDDPSNTGTGTGQVTSG